MKGDLLDQLMVDLCSPENKAHSAIHVYDPVQFNGPSVASDNTSLLHDPTLPGLDKRN